MTDATARGGGVLGRALEGRPHLLRLVVLLVAGGVVAATAVWTLAAERLDRAVDEALDVGRRTAEQLATAGVPLAAVEGVDVTETLELVAAAGDHDRVTLHSIVAGELATATGGAGGAPALNPARLAEVMGEQRARSEVVDAPDGEVVRTLVPLLRVGEDDGVVLETITSLAPLRAAGDRSVLVAMLGLLAAVLVALVPLEVLERQRDRRLREQSGTLAGMLAREARAFGDRNDVEQMKADFLTGVSHGLRTTLHVITGSAQTLARRGEHLTEEQRTAVATRIAVQAQRFDDLVRDLLEVEELADGRPARGRTDVLVGDVLPAVRSATELGEHTLESDVTGVVVKMTTAHLERVLLHLVRNAVQHTPPGSTISVSARRDGSATELVVIDDGPGIPPDERRLVFDPLSRGGSGHADPDPGLGLGLAVVRRVTHIYGGRVWIDDAPGGGAAVHVWIPDVGAHAGVDPFNLPATLAAGEASRDPSAERSSKDGHA